MLNKINKELILQISIILGCLVFLMLKFPIIPIHAQISCNGEPALSHPLDPTKWSWVSGTEARVVVFDTPHPTDFQIISNAVSEWNEYSVANCSGVTFVTERANRPYDPDETLPDNTIFIPRVNPTQVFHKYRNPTLPNQSLKGAIIQLGPGYSHTSNVPPNLAGSFRHTVAHEVGHTFGLINANTNTIMGIAGYITNCDTEAIRKIYCPITPTPTPEPTPIPGGCLAPPDWILYPSTGCASGFQNLAGTCNRSPAFINQCNRFGGYDDESCGCLGGCEGGGCSPIVVDVLGNGFDLTNIADGVDFDIDNDGTLERHSWTSVNTDDAWLALDRDGNGLIDSGKELFGNVTPQPPPPSGEEMQGFLALAMYDGPGYGGNGDGKITRHDAIFDRLKLWQDTNQNGISESCELFSLPDLGLRKLDLDYRESRRVDAHGNQFKYRARVRDAQDAQLERWAWDVFLVVQQP